MADYNRVKIGTIYLTRDGLVTGTPCKVDIPDLARFDLDEKGTVVPIIEGPPQIQLNSLLGENIQMTVYWLLKDEFDDIKDLIKDSRDNNTLINITIDGALGTFDFDCVLVSLGQPGEFNGERIPSITFVWSIANIN